MKKIGVLGTGTMGRDLQVLAQSGFDVVFRARRQSSWTREPQPSARNLDRPVPRKK